MSTRRSAATTKDRMDIMSVKRLMPVVLVALLVGCGAKPSPSPTGLPSPTAELSPTAAVSATPTASPTATFTSAPTPTPTPAPVEGQFNDIAVLVPGGAKVEDDDGTRMITAFDGDLPKTIYTLKVLDVDAGDEDAVHTAAAEGISSEQEPLLVELNGAKAWHVRGTLENTYTERLTFAHKNKVYSLTAQAVGRSEPLDEDRLPILEFFNSLKLL